MSAIPALKRSHVKAAIARIDRDGVPPRRESTKFQLVVDGWNYPPKYVISLAVSHATGRELRPNEFSGGDEANGILLALGFTIAGPGVPACGPTHRASLTSIGPGALVVRGARCSTGPAASPGSPTSS